MISIRRQLMQTHVAPEERPALERELERLRQESTGSHVREDEDPSTRNPLPQQLLKNYILYAKSHCHPRIVNVDGDTIARLYMELRQESKHGGVPITVRHMESIIRLSEAHARMHLREFVKDEDVTAAIALFLRCFLQTQKYSVKHAMENRLRKYLESDSEPMQLIMHHVRSLVRQTRAFERQISGGVEPVTVSVDCSDLEGILGSINVSSESLHMFFKSDDFNAHYSLKRDPATGAPLRIEHTKIG